MLKRVNLWAGLLLCGPLGHALAGDTLPAVVMYTPPVCLACIDYAEHLRNAGFTVRVEPREDMQAVKQRYKVPRGYEAEPTALVSGYFVEGHVPADDIKEFLAEKPKARGLAVPGLPFGAPGREYSNPTCETACTVLDNDSGEKRVRRELYETWLIKPDGSSKIFARH